MINAVSASVIYDETAATAPVKTKSQPAVLLAAIHAVSLVSVHGVLSPINQLDRLCAEHYAGEGQCKVSQKK